VKNGIVKSDLTGLNNLVRALDDKRIVKVGIFGEKNQRNHGVGKTNAEVGAVHEFGSSTVPRRSFLRMPLHQKSDDIVRKLTGIVKDMVETGTKQDPLTLLGIECEAVILDAFDSGGFGQWKALAPSTVRRKSRAGKRGDAILIEWGELRRAIASKVGPKE